MVLITLALFGDVAEYVLLGCSLFLSYSLNTMVFTRSSGKRFDNQPCRLEMMELAVHVTRI